MAESTMRSSIKRYSENSTPSTVGYIIVAHWESPVIHTPTAVTTAEEELEI